MPSCKKCLTNIEEILIDALKDNHEENHDGYYNNDSDTFTVLIICPNCNSLLEVEFTKENEEIVSIEVV
jgi:hypothetical protein